MKTYTLHSEQFLRQPLPEVFSFFESPENLARITPPWMGFRILTPLPIIMRSGATIEYTIRVMGFPVRWQTLISEYNPRQRFVDEQVRGPYSFWHHTHTFVGTHAGTLILDDVRYGMPFGWIGQIAHGLLIRRTLEQIFSHRARMIERIFGQKQPTVDFLQTPRQVHDGVRSTA